MNVHQGFVKAVEGGVLWWWVTREWGSKGQGEGDQGSLVIRRTERLESIKSINHKYLSTWKYRPKKLNRITKVLKGCNLLNSHVVRLIMSKIQIWCKTNRQRQLPVNPIVETRWHLFTMILKCKKFFDISTRATNYLKMAHSETR